MILCLMALVCPISCFSEEKISWYSCRRLRAFSACSAGQASKLDRSSLSRSKACCSASVRVGFFSGNGVNHPRYLISSHHSSDRGTFSNLYPVTSVVSHTTATLLLPVDSVAYVLCTSMLRGSKGDLFSSPWVITFIL